MCKRFGEIRQPNSAFAEQAKKRDVSLAQKRDVSVAVNRDVSNGQKLDVCFLFSPLPCFVIYIMTTFVKEHAYEVSDISLMCYGPI